jgi:hypothetical protein
MTLIFRKQCAQDGIKGRYSFDWGEDDYAVIDGPPFLVDSPNLRLINALRLGGRQMAMVPTGCESTAPKPGHRRHAMKRRPPLPGAMRS